MLAKTSRLKTLQVIRASNTLLMREPSNIAISRNRSEVAKKVSGWKRGGKLDRGRKRAKGTGSKQGVKSFAWLLPTLRGGCKAACNKVGLLLTLRTDVTFYTDGLYPRLLSYQFLFLFFFFFHISPTNKPGKILSPDLESLGICFMLRIGIKR